MEQLRPAELSRWLAEPGPHRPLVLDVREPWEYEIVRLPDSTLIPMREIPARLDELEKGRPVVCLCHHGVRSMQVAWFLASRGYGPIFNLAGGIDAWAREVDPHCPTY